MSEAMTGAQIVLKALQDQGVQHIFGYPGGAVLPIYDEIFQQDAVEHILVRHEQGATHAAEGYARSTGKPGVVLVTSGPGATKHCGQQGPPCHRSGHPAPCNSRAARRRPELPHKTAGL